MAAVDLKAIWQAVAAYYPTASQILALSPVPEVIRGQPEYPEDRFNIVVVDLLADRQERVQASANNIHQTFTLDFNLLVATKGASMLAADDACLDIVSALINATAGLGAYLGTDRSVLISAEMTSGSWDAANDDNLLSEYSHILSVTFYRY